MAESLFTTQVPSSPNASDGSAYTLGTVIVPAVAGQVTHGRWLFPSTLPSGPVQFVLYDATAQVQLGRATFSAPSAGSWNTVALPSPVFVSAGQRLVAAVFTPDRYVSGSGLFASSALTNGNLSAPATGSDPIGNGRFIVLADEYPTSPSSGNSYFADIVFEPGPPPPPPWVNQSSGVAARNGGTSHTIPFGFTSTPSNELVVVVFGAITNTAAGWTERMQPVDTGELSVFTKTSAGESSITVTHNGSNYPVCWAVYELPAGSTWTAMVSSSSATSNTFPQLTGLPGTAQVVWAARGRVVGAATATGASSTWPWLEDVDLFAPHDGVTSGAYLTIGHQADVTAAAVTPAAASTYTGSGFAADRQHAVWAITVPNSDTTAPSVPTGLAVTAVGPATADLTWNAAADNAAVSGYEVVITGP